MPDARAGEAVDDLDAELLRRPGGVLQFLGRPGVHAGRLAVAPDVVGQDRLVPLVDDVQHRLADQVGADRMALQVVLFEQFAFLGAVVGVFERLVDFEMIAPAGQFEAVVAEILALCGPSRPGADRPIGR